MQPHIEEGRDTEEEVQGHKGGGRLSSSLPELRVHTQRGGQGSGGGRERKGQVPRSYSQEPGQNPCRK